MPVTWLGWGDVCDELRTAAGADIVAKEVVETAEKFWKSCSKERQKKLQVARLRYPYGSMLIRDGIAEAPTGIALPESLRVSRGIPFGFITSNCCEVTEAVLAAPTEMYTPQALLRPGDLVGVFELLDRVVPAQGPLQPDWTISAGARSLHFLRNPIMKNAYTRISKHHSRGSGQKLPVWSEDEFSNCDEFDFVRRIKPVWDKCRAWHTSVVYLSQDWITLLEQKLRSTPLDHPAMTFFKALMKAAWRAEARVRFGSSAVYDVLVAWGGRHEALMYEAAFQLLDRTRQVLEGRRPCFQPVTATDSRGPWSEISDGIMKPAKFDEQLMVPHYLQPGEVGYLPLAHVVPKIFEDDPLNKIRIALDIIKTAQREAARRKRVIPALRTDDIFPQLALRLRTGGTPTVQAFRLPVGNEKELLPIGVHDFYDGGFHPDATLPQAACPFFRVAVRIARPPLKDDGNDRQ